MQLQLHGEQTRAFGAEAELPADRRPLVRCTELQIGEAERLYIGDHEFLHLRGQSAPPEFGAGVDVHDQPRPIYRWRSGNANTVPAIRVDESVYADSRGMKRVRTGGCSGSSPSRSPA
ncbi:MAG TPA: hypothetical protein DFL85_05135, partial [Lentisphaeria bacterium]|nr:hypothetical protein [Lentisphaeria bacterium]